MSDHANRMATLLGPKGWLSGEDTRPYSRDWLDRYGTSPIGVARPSSTDEVAELIRLSRQLELAIVPQGGNTSLCGGAVADRADAVILSLARMAAIGEPDFDSGSVLVEGGAALAALHHALEPFGLIFPLHLGAEGSARIGGLIATNAGGSHAFRYGMMQDLVLGLEVVTANGEVWNGLRAVQKDNAGYQLRKLFCGAEGTLGVVTRAVLKLFPAPKQRATALLALPGFAAAVSFASWLRGEAGDFIAALEFLCDFGVSLTLKNVPDLTFPLKTSGPVYVLVELACVSSRVTLDDLLMAALEWGLDTGVVIDGALAASEAQRAHFWRVREEQPEGQRLEGPQLKHDISVPPGKIAGFIETAERHCLALLAGVRINPFGHLADGNIHYNLSPPEGADDFCGKDDQFAQALAGLATDLGGSFAAEHGLGRAKITLADRFRSPVERQLMRRLKEAFDPASMINPGVVIAPAVRKKNFPNDRIS